MNDTFPFFRSAFNAIHVEKRVTSKRFIAFDMAYLTSRRFCTNRISRTHASSNAFSQLASTYQIGKNEKEEERKR